MIMHILSLFFSFLNIIYNWQSIYFFIPQQLYCYLDLIKQKYFVIFCKTTQNAVLKIIIQNRRKGLKTEICGIFFH